MGAKSHDRACNIELLPVLNTIGKGSSAFDWMNEMHEPTLTMEANLLLILNGCILSTIVYFLGGNN